MAGGGALASAIRRPVSPTGTAAWFMVTDDPRGDVRRLREVLGLDSFEAYRLSAASIAPSDQDLTVLRAPGTGSSELIDPSSAPSVNDDLRGLAHRLRRRNTPATTLLSVEPVREPLRNEIVFEVGGQIVEVVPARDSWNRIEIEGRQGRTSFRLDDDGLRVTASSCRHELCRRFGARRGGRIICAPNQLVAHMPAVATSLHGITG